MAERIATQIVAKDGVYATAREVESVRRNPALSIESVVNNILGVVKDNIFQPGTLVEKLEGKYERALLLFRVGLEEYRLMSGGEVLLSGEWEIVDPEQNRTAQDGTEIYQHLVRTNDGLCCIENQRRTDKDGNLHTKKVQIEGTRSGDALKSIHLSKAVHANSGLSSAESLYVGFAAGKVKEISYTKEPFAGEYNADPKVEVKITF